MIDSTTTSTGMAPLNAQGQFRELLGKWEIRHADAIAESVAAQNAFEDPDKMARVLAASNLAMATCLGTCLAQLMEKFMKSWRVGCLVS